MDVLSILPAGLVVCLAVVSEWVYLTARTHQPRHRAGEPPTTRTPQHRRAP